MQRTLDFCSYHSPAKKESNEPKLKSMAKLLLSNSYTVAGPLLTFLFSAGTSNLLAEKGLFFPT